MWQICLRYAWHLPEICLRYVWDMLQLANINPGLCICRRVCRHNCRQVFRKWCQYKILRPYLDPAPFSDCPPPTKKKIAQVARLPMSNLLLFLNLDKMNEIFFLKMLSLSITKGWSGLKLTLSINFVNITFPPISL